MEDQTTANTQVKTVEGQPGSDVPTPSTQTGGEKMFSQEQLNAIIKDRLSKYSDYEDLKNFKQSSEQASMTEIEKLTKKISEYEPYKATATRQQAVLDSLLEEELTLIGDQYKSLIPEQFDTLGKLEYIRKNKSVFKSNTPAELPNLPSDGTPKGPVKPGKYAGKYNTLEEWATRAPREYMQWRAKNPNK